MKTRFLKLLALGATTLSMGLFSSTASADNFDISIGLGGQVAPGVYGRVDISNARYPALVYAEPIMIQRSAPRCEPVYMHVPPGHARRWGDYCGRYGACATPVYFVRSSEYDRGYNRGYRHGYSEAPRYVVPEPRYIAPPQPIQNRWGRPFDYVQNDYRQGYRHGYRDNERDDRREHRGRGHHEGRHGHHGHGDWRD